MECQVRPLAGFATNSSILDIRSGSSGSENLLPVEDKAQSNQIITSQQQLIPTTHLLVTHLGIQIISLRVPYLPYLPVAALGSYISSLLQAVLGLGIRSGPDLSLARKDGLGGLDKW